MSQKKVKESTDKSYNRNLLTRRLSKQIELPVLYQAQPEENDEEGLDLNKFFAIVRRRTLIIASVTVAVAAAAVTYALISKPTYQAKFELLINPVTVEDKLSTSPLYRDGDASKESEVEQTELKILQSPRLTSPVFQQIEDRYPGTNLPWYLEYNIIPKTRIVEVTYQNPNPAKVELVLDLLSKAYLVYSIEERRADVRQGLQFVDEQLPKLHKQVETLQDQLQKFRQKNDLINPASQGEQLSAQLSGIVQQRREIQTQLAKARSLLGSLQKQLQLKPNEAGAASGLSEAPRYQTLLNQLQQIQTQIAVKSSSLREDNPTIQSLRAQERNLLPLVEQERKNILGKNLQGINEKSTALASPNSIRQQQAGQFVDIANQVQALEAQDKSLAGAEIVLREQVRKFPAIARQNDDLARQLNLAAENLNQFLAKREGLRIDLAQKQVPWQLLTPPTKPKATVASIKQNLILGTVLGLVLGFGVALLLEKFNNIFYSPDDVKDTTRLPMLGEIPIKQESSPQIPSASAAGVTGLIALLTQKLRFGKRSDFQQQNSGQFWESLRSLYTNISFLNFDAPVHSLAVISAASGDGKSTIALHLAQTAALMGVRVLLVDADLRNPQIHQMLGLANTKGLSNLIVTDLDFHTVIHQVNCSTHIQENGASEVSVNSESAWEDAFFVLTAGQVPPNPTNLLSSQRMKNLARQFEVAFDLIIYDTSPLLGMADGNLVAAQTDASVLVVGLGKTHRSALEKVLEGLKISKTPVLGVVANGTTSYTSAY